MKSPTANDPATNHRWPVIVIILAGFGLRLYRLGSQSLWYDETVSAFLAGLPAPELIAHTARDIHPPAYYLLLRLWSGLAGSSEFALAFFSLFFGLLLIPLTYRLAGRLASAAVARWAALLVTLSPYHLWYSQEVRMYTLGAALGLGTTLCALYAINSSMSTRKKILYWLAYSLLAGLGLYTLYYFAFLLIALNLVLLWLVLRPVFDRRAFWSLLLANLGFVIVYIPWLPIAWRQATDPPVPPWRAPLGPGPVLLESWSALSLGQSIKPATIWPILLLTLALFGLGCVYLYRNRELSSQTTRPGILSGPARVALLVVYTFGPLLLILAFSLFTPLYHVRYVFTYAPAFYVVLAAGLVWLGQRRGQWSAYLAAAVLVTASCFSIYRYHFDPQYQADDFRDAVKFIETRWQPGDVIMTNAGYVYTAFEYYRDRPTLLRQRLAPFPSHHHDGGPLLLQTGTVNGDPQLGWGDPRSDFYAMSEAETVTALEQMSSTFARLWLLRAYDTVTDPGGLIRAWLAGHTLPIEDQLFSGQSQIRVQGFILPGAPSPPDNEAGPVVFEDGLNLLGWELPNQTWQPGQTIALELWWQATARPQTDYKMSLKLWSSEGELAAQGQDRWPVGSLYRTTDWDLGQPVYHPTGLTLPPDLAPGRYWLNVELYHPDTVHPLARHDGQDPVVTLGPVEVKAK